MSRRGGAGFGPDRLAMHAMRIALRDLATLEAS